MRYLIACLALSSFPAFAAEPHAMSVAFAERPCAEALAFIESPGMDMKGVGNMGMAFGYLLGFQAAHGGDLSGSYETILKRITADCAANPDATALSLLSQYAE